MQRLRLALLGFALGLACCGGIPPESVPSDPIAFVRQEPAKGLLNLEAFRKGLQIKAFDEADEEHTPRLHTTLTLMTVPTGEVRAVPDIGEGALPLDWSADGERLLIGRPDLAGGPIQLLTWDRLNGLYARMSSKRSLGSAALGEGPIQIAGVGRMRSPEGVSFRGVIVRTYEGGPELLTPGRGCIDPDVAPDGKTVIFVRPPRGQTSREPQILMARLGEEEAQPLGRGSHPRYSRDGQWIVFTRQRAGNSDVWLMRGDGSHRRSIVTTNYDEENPAISVHGNYVVYASARGLKEESQLYLTRVEDGVEIQLTRNGQNGRPIW